MKTFLTLLFSLLWVLPVFGQGGPSWLSSGMCKPISGLRDYNGTYEGVQGTGTIGYTTLYRDNEDGGRASGCQGEGCGRHPAVDIPVLSGTPVFASIAGTVVRSECVSGWGGLVVIRSQHPQRYWETIYCSYAHLRKRLVQVGDFVWTGSRIAESGGTTQDTCPGNSSGGHLHFQIDRDDGNTMPWFPDQLALQQYDWDYRCLQYTYNPMALVQGYEKWTFDSIGNTEGWRLGNINAWGVSGGAFWFDPGYDPYVYRGQIDWSTRPGRSSVLSLDATDFGLVYVDMYVQNLSGPVKLYFTTKDEPWWDESKVVYHWPYTWSGYARANVWMRTNPKWQGVVTGLRIDPVENGNLWYFDPVYIGEVSVMR